MEWLSYLDRVEARAISLPRSFASFKREISEKKWAEARQWAGGRTSKMKYRMPKAKSRTAQWLRAPRGSPRGSIS